MAEPDLRERERVLLLSGAADDSTDTDSAPDHEALHVDVVAPTGQPATPQGADPESPAHRLDGINMLVGCTHHPGVMCRSRFACCERGYDCAKCHKSQCTCPRPDKCERRRGGCGLMGADDPRCWSAGCAGMCRTTWPMRVTGAARGLHGTSARRALCSATGTASGTATRVAAAGARRARGTCDAE